MKVLPGGCLKNLSAFYLRVVLFSLPLSGGFCRGCPCAPYWIWSSPVMDGENNDRCVRELGIYQWYRGGNIFVVLVGMSDFSTYVYLGFSLSICFPPWSVFFVGVCHGIVVQCIFHLVVRGCPCH